MGQYEQREWLTLQNGDLQLFGVLHRPRKVQGPTPAVLTCHGFGGTKVGRFRLYVSLAERLAALGVAVLRLDFRGAGDSEGDLTDVTVQGQIEDALIGLEYLSGLDGVDPERIGVLGSSLGGAVATNVAARFQRCRSLGLWAPLFCPQKWLASWSAKQPNFSFSQPTVEGWQVSPEFIQSFMALNVVEALGELGDVPFFHVHGERDELVLIDHAEEYAKARVSSSVESRFVRMPEADHVFSNPKDRERLVEETAQWFSQTL